MSKREHSRRWPWFAAVVVVGVAVIVYRLVFAAPPETVEVVARPLKQTIVSSGQVMPPSEVRLDSLLTTTVRVIHKREGAVVKAGDVLIELDDRDLLAARAQAEAAISQARAGKLGVRAMTLAQARASLTQIRANLAEARADLGRQTALLGGGAATETIVERAQRAVAIYESQEQAALAQVSAASSGGATQLTAAAALAMAEAQLAAVQVNLERAVIVAPLDGVISERFVEDGEVVRPGTALLVLTAAGRTRIVLEPDERNLALLALGQTAQVSAEAYPAQTFAATVGFIAPAVNGTRGTIEVRLDVPTPPAYLRPNMTVSVEVEVATRAQALAVPLAAVSDVGTAQPWVTVVTGRHKRTRRQVTLGLFGDAHVEVVAGLTAGERILAVPAAVP